MGRNFDNNNDRGEPRFALKHGPSVVNEGGNPPLLNNTSPRGGVLLPPRSRVSNQPKQGAEIVDGPVANPGPRGQQHTTPRRSVVNEGGIPPLVNSSRLPAGDPLRLVT